MKSYNYRTNVAAVAVVWLSTIGIHTTQAETIDLRPTSDTFVVDPGDDHPHAKCLNEADCDFGGAGSRAVAAAAAYAEDATAPNNAPHGYFRSLLRFDASELAGVSIASTTLSLYTTPEMTGGKDIFNPKSTSGDFKISLLILPEELEWTQGYGTPGTLDTLVTDPTTGLTHNLLEDLLADPDASLVDVATLHFDADLLDPDEVQTWMSYDFNSATLNEALASGETFSLLLSAADDSVSFNFSCRNQNNYPGDPSTLWDNGPILAVHTVPEPASCVLLAIALTVGIARTYRRRRRPGAELPH